MWQVGATLHRGARVSHYRGLSLRSTGSRCAGSAIVAHGPSHSAACGIFPDQGSNPCPLHWQADSQPLRHQGSPYILFITIWRGNIALWLRAQTLGKKKKSTDFGNSLVVQWLKLCASIAGCGFAPFGELRSRMTRVAANKKRERAQTLEPTV